MTRRRCTIRTFSIGFRDWMREKAKPSVSQEIAGVYRQTNGFLSPAVVITMISVFLLIMVTGLRALSDSGALSAAPPSTLLVLAVAVLAWACFYFCRRLFSFCINSLQFAKSMCERGHQILEGTRAPTA